MSDDVETKYIVYWLNDIKDGGGFRSFIYNNLETATAAAKSFAEGKPGTMFHIAKHITTFIAEAVTVLKEV